MGKNEKKLPTLYVAKYFALLLHFYIQFFDKRQKNQAVLFFQKRNWPFVPIAQLLERGTFRKKGTFHKKGTFTKRAIVEKNNTAPGQGCTFFLAGLQCNSEISSGIQKSSRFSKFRRITFKWLVAFMITSFVFHLDDKNLSQMLFCLHETSKICQL